MLEINMEFRKGILFIRLTGDLNIKTINIFNEEVIPVILKHGLKYIVVNLDKLDKIDVSGIETLMNLNELVSRWDGKASLCSVNKSIKNNFTQLDSKFYDASDELNALEVFGFWKMKYKI